MTERSRRCRYRSPLAVRGGRADFSDTLVVGIMMAAAIAAYAWLIEMMSAGG
jgi:hypothetical protein